MRQALTIALAATFALGACTAKSPTGAGGKTTTTTTATASKTPKPAATTAAVPTPAPLTGTIVSGLVQVDAHYVIAAGGGNVIAAGGGNVIAAGGGNVIAAGGGNVIAAGGGNYRVQAATDVPVGTILPVKGMLVTAVSMVTGKAFGAAVTTDEHGGFKVGVPEGTADNVLLIASFPGSDNPRLTYPLVVSPKGASAQIDEDTALVTKYLRQCLVGRIAGLLALPVSEDPVGALSGSNDFNEVPAPIKSLAATVLGNLQKRAGEKGVDKAPEATRRKAARRISEVLLAKTDLDKLSISKTGKNAIATLVDIMRQEREAAATLLKSDPTYFKTHERYTKSQFYAKDYPDGVQRPSDVGQFLVTEYFSNVSAHPLIAVAEVHKEIGVPDDQSASLNDAAGAIVQALILKLITDGGSQSAMLAIFDEP